MTNRVTIIGTLRKDPSVRSFTSKGVAYEVVSLWLEVESGERKDRFAVEIFCPRLGDHAKTFRRNVIVEVEGALRCDCWKSGDVWKSKTYIGIDAACGAIRSQGLAAAT